MRLRFVESFPVVDGQGNQGAVSIYQRLISVRGGGWAPGLKEVFDQDGEHVNRIDDDTYQVVVTGEVLTRI